MFVRNRQQAEHFDPVKARLITQGQCFLLPCMICDVMRDRPGCEQEVLDIVRGSLERFDAVCLATALHRMAALEAAPERAALTVERPEFARLTAAIGARPANQRQQLSLETYATSCLIGYLLCLIEMKMSFLKHQDEVFNPSTKIQIFKRKTYLSLLSLTRKQSINFASA